MTYEPQAGTFAARVIAHLKTLPDGTWLASAVLAEELGQPSGQVHALLQTARKHGLVQVRKKPGERVLLWALGDGKPIEYEADDEHETAEGRAHATTPPAEPGTVPSNVFALAPQVEDAPAAPPPSSPVEKPEVMPDPAELPHRRVRAGTAPFRCGIFSDGQLVLERGSQSMVLERIEFESLVQFLERTLLEKVA